MGQAEQRSEERHWVYHAAKVIEGGKALAECAVLDVSRSGVRIGIGGTHLLPERFRLVDVGRSTAFEARVVWRLAHQAGLVIESDLSRWWFSSARFSLR